MMYGSWGMKHDRHNFLVILSHFLPFYPTNNPKNQNFEKMKKLPRDIIILHKCTKNHDYMLHCSWDMARDGCNLYFSFWDIFPFYPSNNPSRFSGIDACNTILFQIKFFGRKIKENTLAIHLMQITALFSLT